MSSSHRAFRGSRVLPAVLSALASQHGMGSTGGPERALLGGCGTGGLGAMVNLDYAVDWVSPNVMVHGLLDAALLLDLAPVTRAAAMPLPEQASAVYRVANASARAWPACAATYGASSWDAWRCIYGVYRLPFVRVSFLLAQPQYEAAQLRANEGGAVPPYAPASRAAAYAQKFGDAMRTQLAMYPRSDQQGSAVFAPACYAGCLTTDGAYFTVRLASHGASRARCGIPDARSRRGCRWRCRGARRRRPRLPTRCAPGAPRGLDCRESKGIDSHAPRAAGTSMASRRSTWWRRAPRLTSTAVRANAAWLPLFANDCL